MFRCIISTILFTFLLLRVVDSFSTPARSSPTLTRSYISGGYGHINAGTSRSFGFVENAQPQASYTSNYITAIEDQSTCPFGLFVASTDHNYAIVSPNLKQQNWLSLVVNGEQVYIIKRGKDNNSTENVVVVVALTSMSLAERDFIAEIRSNFTQNLAGLKFAYYTSGSSLIIGSRPKVAENTYKLANNNNNWNLVQQNNNREYLSSRGINSPHYGANGRSLTSRPLLQQANGRNYGAFSHTNNHQQPTAAATTATAATGGNGASSQAFQMAGQCQFGPTIETNYYNLQMSPLNKTLAGDVYFFDFYCNILDVYSSTVSIRRNSDSSLLYRDQQFFTYSSSNLSQSVNRLFILNDWIIFIYKDGTLSIKGSQSLEANEFNSIVKVRSQLRNIANWQQNAAQLMPISESDNNHSSILLNTSNHLDDR